jgi:hypothetical protein
MLDLLEAEAGRADLVCSQLFSLDTPRKDTLCRAIAVSGTSVVYPDPDQHPDPDPHHFEKPDPHPDPIKIRIRIK